MPRTIRIPLAVVLIAAVVTLAAVAIMPRPANLSDDTTGDAQLAETVRDLAGNGHRGLSVAMIDDGSVRFAGVGTTGGPDDDPVGETTAYELGSITKGMTGMLLADSGLDPETPVADLLPQVEFGDDTVAAATLADLASHRAGLPSVRFTPDSFARGWVAEVITGADPYAGDTATSLLADAAAVSAGDKGDVSYSNLGVALLGLALAEDAAMSYPELLTERILNPLGMDNTVVASTSDELPANRAYGSRANGRPAEPWFEFGWGGAGGGVWSTSQDVAALLLGLMDGTAPGADATTPRFDAGSDEEVGYGWFTEYRDGRSITWHNGGTGGFSTWAGFDAEAGTGAVVLGNTDRDVDSIGWALLDLDHDSSFDWRWLFLLAAGLGFSLYAGLVVVMNRRPDRIGLVRDASLGVLLLLAARSIGTWEVIPPVVWLIGVAGLAGGVVKVALSWPDLPLRAYGRHWARVTGAVVSILLLIGFVALLVAT